MQARKSLLLSLIAVALLLSFHAMPTHAQTPKTIYDVIAARPDLSTLAAALKVIGFDKSVADNGPYTVFAPNDAAFAAALKDANITADQLLADVPTLQAILLYHIVPGYLGVAAITNAGQADPKFQLATTKTPESLSVLVKDRKVYVNDAQIIDGDLDVDGGTVHVIDKALFPQDITLKPPKTVVGDKPLGDTLAALPNLKTFTAASTLIFGKFEGLTNYTFFVPNDAAFDAVFKAANVTADKLTADKTQLSRIIRYHMVPWYFTSEQLLQMDGQSIGTAVKDMVLNIKVRDSKVILNDQAVVVTPDVGSQFGNIVHILDAVLITGAPTSPLLSATPTK